MASGVELATAYISIVAETKELSDQIDDALKGATKTADTVGRELGVRLARNTGTALKGAASEVRDLATAQNELAQAQTRSADAMERAAIRGNWADMSEDAEAAAEAVGEVGSSAEDSGGAFEELGEKIKSALTLAGITASAAGVVGVLRSAIDEGTAFERSLNSISGVAQATAAQMDAIRSRANDLGTDTELVGVTAQGATDAMLELVKGGFSVEQSMEAVRGTLQLAGAAQVEAGQAAVIQADALHSFGLQADQAARVADVLANVANASTGEMTDFAYGFQMGGAVMNQFGITVEEAASGLGVLANAGIKGSDAGTLIKSMLLAIASPSDPAKSAMDDLGLSVWDATGKFVGLREVMLQLQEASKRMTPEQYAEATSTAFGSDAARLAGVAANNGVAAYDSMYEAINRVGTAQNIAESNVQGLPGVMERLSNTAAAAKLALFELVKGPTESVGNAINELSGKGVELLQNLRQGDVPEQFDAVADSVRDAAPLVADLAVQAAKVAGALGMGAFKAGLEALDSISNILDAAVIPALQALSGLLDGNEAAVAGLVAAFLAMKFAPGLLQKFGQPLQNLAQRAGAGASAMNRIATANGAIVQTSSMGAVTMGRFGSQIAAIGQHVPAISRMQTAFMNGATSGATFARTVGTAQAAMSGLRSVGSGVINMLGGPWGAAMVGITIATMGWAQASADAKNRAEGLAEATHNMAVAQADMYEALSKSSGEVDDTVVTAMTDQVNALKDSFDAVEKGPGFGDWINVANEFGGVLSGNFNAIGDGWDQLQAELNKQDTAEWSARLQETMSSLDMSVEDLSKTVVGTQGDWDALVSRLKAAGDGGADLLAQLEPLREQFLDDKAAAEALTPGVAELEEAIGTLADTTSTAEEKTNALKVAMDTLAGVPPDMQEATAQHNETIREVAAAALEAADGTLGMGDALVNANGSVNTATENGAALYETLKELRDATLGVAGSGGDLEAAFAQDSAQLDALATKFGLTREQIDAMAAAIGYIPTAIETHVGLAGSEETEQKLLEIQDMLTTAGVGASIQIDAPGSDLVISALESTGAKLEYINVNGRPQLRITADTTDSMTKLQELIRKLQETQGEASAIIVPGQYGPRQVNIPYGPSADRGPSQGYVPYNPGASSSTPDIPTFDPNSVHGNASGGAIRGPGTGTSDDVLMWGSNGEHMWTAAEVRAVGGHGKMEQLRALAQQGMIPGFSQGGRVKKPGASNSSTGGVTGNPYAAIDYAYQNAVGQPYAYGSAGANGQFDCSGIASAIYNAATGRNVRFMTDSDFSSYGFLPGYQPGALNIGTNGGSGQNGHMAVTLPNGVNVESGGSLDATVYGQGAQGAQNFTQQWHLPMAAGDPNVASAMASMPGAGTQPTGAATAPGAELTRTEGYIPAAAGSTGVAGTSFASSLLNMGAEAVNGLIDQGASMASAAGSAAANAFAPGSGAGVGMAISMGAGIAKRGVSYGFQMAGIGVDALIEQLFPFGAPRWLGYDYTGFMPQLPNMAAATTTAERGEAAAAEQASAEAATGTQHGTLQGQAPGPSMTTPLSPTNTGASTSGMQGGGFAAGSGQKGSFQGGGPPAQQPAAASTPDWLKQFGLFDSGGWLEPGMAGINLSKRPEPVFSGAQWDAITASAEHPADYGTGLTIENMTVQDWDEAHRELKKADRRRALQYMGRP